MRLDDRSHLRRWHRLVLFSSVSLTVIALAFSAAAQAQIFSPPISVSKNPIRPQPGAIVVDSNGNIVVAWRDASGISFSRSTDGQRFHLLKPFRIAGAVHSSRRSPPIAQVIRI